MRVRMRPEGERVEYGIVVVAARCLHVHRLVGRDLSVRAQEVHPGQLRLSKIHNKRTSVNEPESEVAGR